MKATARQQMPANPSSPEITVLAAVDGKETQLVYASPVAHAVGEQVQVTYSWDQPDSEPLEALDERNDD